MYGRIDRIASYCIREASKAKMKADQFDVIMMLNEVQRDIATRALAFQDTVTVHLKSGVSDYQISEPIWKIYEAQEPQSWLNPLVIIHDIKAWKEIINNPGAVSLAALTALGITLTQGVLIDNNGLIEFASNPVFAILWNGKLSLFPSPQVDDDLTLFVINTPSEIIPDKGDPDLPFEWDRCLRYGVCSEIIGGDWKLRYEQELSEMTHRTIKSTIKDPDRVLSRTDELGW